MSVLIFTSQSQASAAIVQIGKNMGLDGNGSIIAGTVTPLVDGRFAITRPPDAFMASVAGYTEASSLAYAAVGEMTPGVGASVPTSITNYQARAQLTSMPTVTPNPPAGRTLFNDVNDALTAEGGLAWQAWEYANDIYRTSTLVDALASQLSMTSAQMDQFFIAAAGISA